MPRGRDVFSYQTRTAFPFPTLWIANEETAGLLAVLPNEEEIFGYLDAFQRRAQSCSFPHMPEECTPAEVRRFIDNIEHNAAMNPDMLALLFATMAQGAQNGVYDKFGERWIAGAMDREAQRGDVFSMSCWSLPVQLIDHFTVAAAMQALRIGSFLSRPTLLTIETLIMIGPYLTNSGRFLDAWAVFGVTIRLAQSLGCRYTYMTPHALYADRFAVHRDPNRLSPPAPSEQVAVRKSLWWWMLHLDQQYSMTLGRPLGISSLGDCPAPEPLILDPVIQSLSNYINQFTVLARQILSAGYLNNDQIDKFTDQLVTLKGTLPQLIQFDQSWLNKDKPTPPWPLNAQAAVYHGKTHNFLLLLNRQRIENVQDTNSALFRPETEGVPVARGRERVLQSSRALLHAFEFFHSRLQAALICWTMGQQAFNAAMILVLSMFETKDPQDLHIVQLAMTTFQEMSRLGVHRLAGPALEKLSSLIREFHAGDAAKEKVMGHQGMFLLEDQGLQGFKEEFSPLQFGMAEHAIAQDRPSKRHNPGDTDLSSPSTIKQGMTPQPSRRKPQPKAGASRGIRPKVPLTKSMSRSQRPPSLRKISQQISPKLPREQVRSAHSAGDIPLMIPESGAIGFFTTQPGSAPQTAFPTDDHAYQPFQSSNFDPSTQVSDVPFIAGVPRSNTFPQERAVFSAQQHQPPMMDPNAPPSNPGGDHMMPASSSAAFEGQQTQFAGFGMEEEGFPQFSHPTSQARYLASPYSISGVPTSYPHQY